MEQQQQKSLNDFTTTELKALAFDFISSLELTQNNLRAINQELARRAQLPQNKPLQVIEPLPAGSIQTV